MDRTNAYIGSSTVDDRAVVLKQCPVTCGRPTRMTEDGFARLCAHHRKNETAWVLGHERPALSPPWCVVCQGKEKPAELELVALPELKQSINTQPAHGPRGADMPKKRGMCEGGCGQTGLQVGVSAGVAMCSTCATIHAHVNNRLPVVIGAIQRLGKAEEVVKALAGDQVAVAVESKTLRAIAMAVGFSGDVGQGLIDAVDSMAKDYRLRTGQVQEVIEKSRIVEADRDRLHELLVEMGEAVGSDCKHNYAATLDTVRRLAMQPSPMTPPAAAQLAELEANINRIYASLGIEPGDEEPIDVILDAISVLTLTLDRYRNQAERLAAENTTLANQVADLEQQNAVSAQVFSMINEALDCPHCLPEELPARVAALGKPIPAGMERISAPSPLDSHLLDLVIDFPGIPVERIAAIREAA